MDNALKQYIDLFREHRDALEQNSCAPLNALRPEALAMLETMHLPREGQGIYDAFSLEKALAPDYGVNFNRLKIPGIDPLASFKCNVPAISPAMFFLINDAFATSRQAAQQLPDGLTVTSIRRAAEENPRLLDLWLGSAADMANPIVALNSLLAQDGVLIHAARGVKVEKPIQLVNILSCPSPLLAPRRVLVVAEEGAELTVLSCDHTQSPGTPLMALQVVEIVARIDSRVDWYDMEESSAKTTRLSAFYADQHEGSHVNAVATTLLNGSTRNEYYHRLLGPGAELSLRGMGIEDDSRRLSSYTRIDHQAPRCHSDEMFKYSVDDTAAGGFGGLIYVSPGAVKTEAYQSNRNLVGSDTATMVSKPQLEIYNDDVKCSHGSATGQLDPMQIFYMRTRGLSLQQALLLLKQAFMADVIDAVAIPALRDRLHHIVEMRFAGQEASCGDCAACKSPQS